MSDADQTHQCRGLRIIRFGTSLLAGRQAFEAVFSRSAHGNGNQSNEQ